MVSHSEPCCAPTILFCSQPPPSASNCLQLPHFICSCPCVRDPKAGACQAAHGSIQDPHVQGTFLPQSTMGTLPFRAARLGCISHYQQGVSPHFTIQAPMLEQAMRRLSQLEFQICSLPFCWPPHNIPCMFNRPCHACTAARAPHANRRGWTSCLQQWQGRVASCVRGVSQTCGQPHASCCRSVPFSLSQVRTPLKLFQSN